MRRDDSRGLRTALQPWLARFDYATLTLTGRESTVVVLRAWGAADSPVPAPALLTELTAAMDLARALPCKETRATDWLLDPVVRSGSTAELRKWLFAPLATPPAAGLDLAAMQVKTKCGSNCGSCLPELKRLVTQGAVAIPAGA